MATNEMQLNEISEQIRNSWKIPSICQFACIFKNLIGAEFFAPEELEYSITNPELDPLVGNFIYRLISKKFFKKKEKDLENIPYEKWNKTLAKKMEQYYKKYTRVLGMHPKINPTLPSEKKDSEEKINYIKEEKDSKFSCEKNEISKMNEEKDQADIDSKKESKEISEVHKNESKEEQKGEIGPTKQESHEQKEKSENENDNEKSNLNPNPNPNSNPNPNQNENDVRKGNILFKEILFGDNKINPIDPVNLKDLQFESLIIVKFFEELGGSNPMLMIEEKNEDNKNIEMSEEGENNFSNKNNKSEKKFTFNHFHQLSLNERVSILYYLCYLKANVEEKDYSQHINDNNEIKSIRQIDPIGVDENNYEYFRFEFNKDGRIYKLAPLLERKNNGDKISTCIYPIKRIKEIVTLKGDQNNNAESHENYSKLEKYLNENFSTLENEEKEMGLRQTVRIRKLQTSFRSRKIINSYSENALQASYSNIGIMTRSQANTMKHKPLKILSQDELKKEKIEREKLERQKRLERRQQKFYLKKFYGEEHSRRNKKDNNFKYYNEYDEEEEEEEIMEDEMEDDDQQSEKANITLTGEIIINKNSFLKEIEFSGAWKMELFQAEQKFKYNYLRKLYPVKRKDDSNLNLNLNNNTFTLYRDYSIAGKCSCCEKQNVNGYNETNICNEISGLYKGFFIHEDKEIEEYMELIFSKNLNLNLNKDKNKTELNVYGEGKNLLGNFFVEGTASIMDPDSLDAEQLNYKKVIISIDLSKNYTEVAHEENDDEEDESEQKEENEEDESEQKEEKEEEYNENNEYKEEEYNEYKEESLTSPIQNKVRISLVTKTFNLDRMNAEEAQKFRESILKNHPLEYSLIRNIL